MFRQEQGFIKRTWKVLSVFFYFIFLLFVLAIKQTFISKAEENTFSMKKKYDE